MIDCPIRTVSEYANITLTFGTLTLLEVVSELWLAFIALVPKIAFYLNHRATKERIDPPFDLNQVYALLKLDPRTLGTETVD
jgi:hypothetical protein